MPVTSDKPAPYAPLSAILGLIERNRTQGLPAPVNAVVLGRAGVADSLIPRTLQALQALDLIEENGNLTALFEGLRKAPQAEFKQRLEDWLKAAYADVFTYVDPSTDDEIKIRDAFRDYNPVGQQSRMMALFLGLCGAAGLVPEKPTQPRPRARKAAQTPTKRRIARKQSFGIPDELAGLFAHLPKDGQSWTKNKRDNFMKAFGVVLDLCVPVVEDEAPKQEPERLEQI